MNTGKKNNDEYIELEDLKAFIRTPTTIIAGCLILLIIIFGFITPVRNLVYDNFMYYFIDSMRVSTKYHFERGGYYWDKGKYNLAIRTYKHKLQNFEKESIMSIKQMDMYQKESVYNIGVAYYTIAEKIRNSNRKKAIKYYDFAKKYFEIYKIIMPNHQHGDIIDNALVYMDSLDDMPNIREAQIYKNKGNDYYYKEMYDLALVEYYNAITLDPTFATVYNNIGTIYYKKAGKIFKTDINSAKALLKDSVSAWEKAILFNEEEYSNLYLNLGVICADYLEEYEKGLEYLKKYLKKFPRDKQAANIREKINRINMAILTKNSMNTENK